MTPPSILEEIRRVRHAVSQRIGHDPQRIAAHYAELQRRHRDRIVNLSGDSSSGQLVRTTSRYKRSFNSGGIVSNRTVRQDALPSREGECITSPDCEVCASQSAVDRKAARTLTPTGSRLVAQGRPRSGRPWVEEHRESINPNGVASHAWLNPVGVETLAIGLKPRVSRCAGNPGLWSATPLGSGNRRLGCAHFQD